MPGYRYTITNSAGEDLGTAEYTQEISVGERICLTGNQWVTVTAVIPHARIAEFHDRPLHGILEVAAADKT